MLLPPKSDNGSTQRKFNTVWCQVMNILNQNLILCLKFIIKEQFKKNVAERGEHQ